MHHNHFAKLFRPSRPDSIETPPPCTPTPLNPRHCSGLLGRTLLRPGQPALRALGRVLLFRPSRPDSIETRQPESRPRHAAAHCSGLLGRTLLRRGGAEEGVLGHRTLFRPSRPDSIETPTRPGSYARVMSLFRPSRPDSIETEGQQEGRVKGDIVPAF